jgi:hypothetical protein
VTRILPLLALVACTGDNPARREIDRRAADPASPGAAEVWTCPMHPDVRAAERGSCPECGMPLQERG